MLVVYRSLWFSIFLGSYYHSAAPISGHANGYWGYDTPFHIFPKSLSYWLLEVKEHAALLKYRHWIFWHMYRVCLVGFPWTMNSMGSQPWHMSVTPPTAWTTFLDEMRLFIVSPIFRRCLSPLRHMVAPLLGKIIILVLQPLEISLACLGSGFGENGTIYVSISLIWPVSLNVYVPVAWLNVMWAMSVCIAVSLAPGLFLTTWGGFLAWHTLDRWLGFPQLLRLSPSWWDPVLEAPY